jgi:hypothetical protein
MAAAEYNGCEMLARSGVESSFIEIFLFLKEN